MKKIYAVITLLTVAALVDIYFYKQQQTSNQNSIIVEENTTFNQGYFTLELPELFEAKDGIIKPKSGRGFPRIRFDVSKKIAETDLFSLEKERVKNLCGQTDACGEIIANEDVTVNGVKGIKLTIKYKGRGVGDNQGSIYEYRYSLENNGNIFRFWTDATDNENPENVKSSFEAIMQTFSPLL